MPRKSKKTVQIGEEYNIQELDIDSIRPSSTEFQQSNSSAGRYAILAAPNTGKSFLIKDLMYAKQDIIPFAQIHSGTDQENKFYKSFCPDITIYDELNINGLEDFVKRQKLARKYLDNPWGCLVLDDVFDDPSALNKPIVHTLLKNGRHYKMMMLLGSQYSMDMKPAIRSCFDGFFILKENVPKNREKLYHNYGAGIPSLELFHELMDNLTTDHMAMYIGKATTNNLEDIVKYYKASDVDKNWRFGSQYAWDYHNARYDPEHDRDLL